MDYAQKARASNDLGVEMLPPSFPWVCIGCDKGALIKMANFLCILWQSVLLLEIDC
jgi:hypothetical protein